MPKVSKLGLRKELIDALRPFVESYRQQDSAIGDSDLYDEQPMSVHVTLGDIRKASRALWRAEG